MFSLFLSCIGKIRIPCCSHFSILGWAPYAVTFLVLFLVYDIVDLEYGMGAGVGGLGSWDWDGLVWELGDRGGGLL